MTQGSSCLATLGFGTESRWDSQMQRPAYGFTMANSRSLMETKTGSLKFADDES